MEIIYLCSPPPLPRVISSFWGVFSTLRMFSSHFSALFSLIQATEYLVPVLTTDRRGGKASTWGRRQVAVAASRGKQPEESRNSPAPFTDKMYLPFANGLQFSETSYLAGRWYSKIVSPGLHLCHFSLEVDQTKVILGFCYLNEKNYISN